MLRTILFFLSVFYCVSLKLQAEPLYPLLSQTSVDSVLVVLQKSKPDSNRVNICLQLSKHYLNKAFNKAINYSMNMDSSYFYSKQAQDLSMALSFTEGSIQSQYLIGCWQFRTADKESARALVNKALMQSRQLGNKELEAAGWYFLGECHQLSQEEIPEKIRCLEQSMRIYKQTGNHEQEGYLLEAIANLHFMNGKPAQANSELLQVLALYHAAHYPKLHYTYNLLIAINRQLGNYKEAIQYGLAAIESAKATKDTVELGEYYVNLARTYVDLDQWQDSFRYFEHALSHFKQEKNIFLIHDIAGNVSQYLIAQGKAKEALDFYLKTTKDYPPDRFKSKDAAAKALAECYMALHQYLLAEKYYLEVLRINEQFDANTGIFSYKFYIYHKLGNFYVTVKQYDKARNYLEKALNLGKHAGTLKNQVDIQLLLFKTDSAQGKLREAIAHYQVYKALNDSIFNENKSKQIANLQIQYETKEKEQNIALLTNQNQVQLASIRQKELQRNSFIAGTVLLLLLSAVIYNRYRLKQQSNQLLQARQEEIDLKNKSLEQVLSEKENLLVEKEWMMKEIHHRVKNNLQLISGLLYSQSSYLQDPAALTAIRDSHNRVHAMALIHQRLYQFNNLECVAMQAYIEEIVTHLLNSFKESNRIKLELDISAIELDITLAVPLGLIINEAVTNALKYAFPYDHKGIITVCLQPLDSQTYLLTIADNGIGLPDGFNIWQSRTLGLSMIQGLSRQIKGNLQINHQAGVQISLQFNVIKFTKSHVLFS